MKILDIGAGNLTQANAFAEMGFEVTAGDIGYLVTGLG